MKYTKAQTTVRVILGLFFIFTGVGHLTFLRIDFLAQVPNWVPMQPDTVVLLSGIVEVLLGISLLRLQSYMTSVGWVVAIFLIAVFPGNIAQLINHTDAFGLNSDLLRWLRLPLQPILIILVLWSTGAWQKWRNKIKLNNRFQN